MKESSSSDDVWAAKHAEYKKADWVDKPTLFAEAAINYFPKNGSVLELGAGQGQDTRYFAEHGYQVTSTDQSQTALEDNQQKIPNKIAQNISIMALDMHQKFTFANDTFDVVYAHLSLHYFDEATTKQIFAEIHRVLVPGGTLAFFVNSTSDSEYNTGKKLEDDLFEIGGKTKRFFNVESIKKFTSQFGTKLLDNKGETYKDAKTGVHHLIRYIGVK